MTVAALAHDAPDRARSWLDFLRAELAPTPGRFNATVRIVVATTIVLVTSMALELRFTGLSVFVVMFLTMAAADPAARNSVFVGIASTLAIVVITLAIALTIVILRFTIDYPPLRLGAMALVAFVGMYLARVLPSPAAGFLLTIVVFVSQAYVDLFPGGEQALRAVLWVWVSVAYPAAVAVGVNLLLLPADPDPLLRRELAERLRAVARAISAPGARDELVRFATLGSGSLLKLVGLAELRDASLKPMHAERVAKIGLVQELLTLAALHADLAIEPSPARRARLARVAQACERYAEAISSGAGDLPVLPSAAEGDEAPSARTSVLAEMERIVRELPLAERPQADQPGHAKGPLAADAWTNPKYAQFALKVTAAAMFCYIAYTAVDWYGIHTCMITCTIVALGASAGATIAKSTLRLVGCAIGGLIALASIVFLLPHMTSITQLALLVGAVAALGGWIAMGSERTNYVGLQLAFAVYLPLLEAGYVPTTDVTEMRDRFIGIVFGVIVMALVFSYVWPERAGTGMVRALEAALRHMAAGQRAAAWQSLAQAEQLAELFAFEVEARTPAGAEEGRRIGRLIELTRRVLLAQSALDGAMDPTLERAVGLALESVATRIETGAAGELAVLPRVEVQSGLQEALIERVEALVRA